MHASRGLVLLALVLILAACGDVGPALDSRPATTEAPPPERYGAPVVAAPRDVSGLVGSPCTSLLATEELDGFGISNEGRPRTYLGATICSWTTDSDDRLSLSVDAERDLLVDTYRTRLTPIFVPTNIEGFPAVRQRTSLDYNTCTVTTGLGPQEALEADWTGHLAPSPSVDPCERAEEAIALVIRKLPPQR